MTYLVFAIVVEAAVCGAVLLIGKRIATNRRKAAEHSRPSVVNAYLHRCHYCDNEFDTTREPWLKRNCPNCKDETYFHRECGLHLFAKVPYCNGVYVGHSTGHTVSLKYPRMCAHCSLGREYWNQQRCTTSMMGTLNKAMTFTEKDEAWLHTLKISLYDTVTKG